MSQPKGAHQGNNRKWDLECYNCGKKGHFAWDYWFRKKKMAESNVMTSKVEQGRNHESEKEQDTCASFVIIIIIEKVNVKKKCVDDDKRQMDTKFAFKIY